MRRITAAFLAVIGIGLASPLAAQQIGGPPITYGSNSAGGGVSSVTGAGTVVCSPTTGAVTCTGSASAGGMLTDGSNSTSAAFDNIVANSGTITHSIVSTVTDGRVLDLAQNLDGSNSFSAIKLLGTWNTSAAGKGITVDITNTASDPTLSGLLDLQTNNQSLFQVNTEGSATLFSLPGITTSSNTSLQVAFDASHQFTPDGASLAQIRGINDEVTLNGSSLTITDVIGALGGIVTNSGYTGTITNGHNFYSETPTIGGTNPITTFAGFDQAAITNGSGNTTGTITNTAINLRAATAVSGVGGTMVNKGVAIALPSGTNAGTTTNTGLEITGNGQTGGTTTNWAIHSTSTAPSSFAGALAVVGATTFTAAPVETAVALSGCNGSTATMNLSSGGLFYCTVSTGGVTFAVSNNATTGLVSSFTVELTNPGSQTLTWMSGTKWPGGAQPAWTAAGVDAAVCYTRDGATTWRCARSMADSK